jgi:hypothetical protein
MKTLWLDSRYTGQYSSRAPLEYQPGTVARHSLVLTCINEINFLFGKHVFVTHITVGM